MSDACTHESATGVDQTDLADEAKVWRCDGCGFTYRNVVTSTENDEFMVMQRVERCLMCGGSGEIVMVGGPFIDRGDSESGEYRDQCPACSSTGWVGR